MIKNNEFSKTVTELQAHYTKAWHLTEEYTKGNNDKIIDLIIEQHHYNFDLWHEEDKAREPGVNNKIIATVKRNIDALNQKRNDTITKIDIALEDSLFQGIAKNNNLPWNSETIGSIIDRLSIASLKVFHMQEQVERQDASTEHVENCKNKVAKLKIQLNDLAQSLQEFYSDIITGKKQNKLYHQFKMYNDPTLNPKIYQQTENINK